LKHASPPPLLPLLDWKTVSESGKHYTAWISGAGFPEKRQQMEAFHDALKLTPQAKGFLFAPPQTMNVVAMAEGSCSGAVAVQRKVGTLYKVDVQRRMVVQELVKLLNIASSCEP